MDWGLHDNLKKKFYTKQGRHKKDPRKAKSETNAPTSPRKEERRAGGGRQIKLPKIIPHRAVSIMF